MLPKNPKQSLKKILIGVPVIALLGFVALKMYPLVHGPRIILSDLHDGATLAEPVISLSGQAKYTKELVINGNALATSPAGDFDDTILLSPGYNVITVSATDKFGKTETKNYAIVLAEEADGTFTATNVPPYTGGI